MPHELRILIADNHSPLRSEIKLLLKKSRNVIIAGEVENGDQAITETLDLLPDLLLLDLAMPRLPGLDAMRAIMSGFPQIRILLLSRNLRAHHLVEALQVGARGIVLKDSLAKTLLPAIHCVSDGGYWLEDQPIESLVLALHRRVQEQKPPEQQTYGLTRRELEVVRSIVDGCTNRDVAQRYGLSEETVKRHLSNVFNKVGVSTRLELALFALSNHLVNG